MNPYYDEDGITIYHGDCREVWASLIFDLNPVIVTDPPYGIAWQRSANLARNSKAHDGIVGDSDTTVRDEMLARVSGFPGVVFGSFYAPFPADVRQVLVWQKPADSGVVGSTTGYRRDVEPIFLIGDWPLRPVRWSSCLRSVRGIAAVTSETGHPHTKPLSLLLDLIERAPEGIIFDPFMGSGTTLRAAKDLGRRAIGIEIEERYCEIAVQRLAQGVLPLGASS